jgi:hypothetical protein
MGNLCCAKELSVQFIVQFFVYTVELHSLTWSVWGPLDRYLLEHHEVNIYGIWRQSKPHS